MNDATLLVTAPDHPEMGALRRALGTELVHVTCAACLEVELRSERPLRAAVVCEEGLDLVETIRLIRSIRPDLAIHLPAALGKAPELRLAPRGASLAARQLAHDLNNLLMVIYAFAQGDGPQASRLTQIGEACRRARELTSRLTTPAPTREQRVGVRSGVSALRSVIRRVTGPRVAVQIRVHASDEAQIPLSLADLERVLVNLTLNASQAMGGEGKLTVRVREIESRAEVRLTVTDSGPGLEPELAQRALEPGVSGRGGSGLGLSAVAALVRGAGGRLELEAAPSGGLLARVTLPLASPAERCRDRRDRRYHELSA